MNSAVLVGCGKKVFKLAKVVAVDELVVYLVETNNENSERQSHET
jgi:hypothetical protein